MKKQPRYITVFIAGGLCMAVIPGLFKEYIPLPDFARGFLIGAGLVFETVGLVLSVKQRKGEIGSCL